MKQEKNWVVVFGSLITTIVLAAIITIAIWGAISAVRLAPRLFGSIEKTFEPPSAIILSPLEIQSGVPFTLSWETTDGERGGFYTVLFACAEGLELTEVWDTGQTPIVCGTSLETAPSVTSMRITPRITNDADETVIPISITHLSPEGEKLSEGITSLTVVAAPPQEAPLVVEEQSETPQETIGTPDLVIRPIAIGVIDPRTGSFIQKGTFGSYEIVSVKFDVKNQGDGRADSWAFTAHLPTRPGRSGTPTPYQSPVQQPLGPGDHIEFNLDFGTPTSGTVRINVDPANAIHESSEYNNSLSEYISVLY